MRVNVSCFVLFLTLFLSSAFASESPISFVRKQEIDIIDGGGPEIVTLKISGREFNAPFTWSVSVTNSTGELFFQVNDDSWLNAFFGDAGYIEGCIGYKECKEKWYFNDLLSEVLNGVSSQGPSQPEHFNLEAIDSLASEYLRNRNLSNTELMKAVSEMKASHSAGFIRLSIPISPVQDGASYMYVKSLNYFVPYWDD